MQLAIALWFALETPHNGWVWYSGGDATEYWSSEWAVAHLRLTQTIVGWGLPVLYAWVPLVTGSTLLAGLPVIVAFQLLVLVPLVVVLVWLVADRLFGRLYAWCAAGLWVVGPLLLLLGIRRHDYRVEFEQYFLAPHVYGLTNMADLPSVAITLATAWAILRAVDSPRTEEWVFAGLLGGVAIGIKPANAFLLVAVVVLLALTRQMRGAVVFGAALAPAVVVLAIWKQRGLGNLPLFSVGAHREAAGPLASALPSRYVPWDLHHLKVELRDFMEVFWSVRLLEWIALAGIVAVVRRSPAKGAFVAAWFVMFSIVKGSSAQASIDTTSYFRLTEPGLPAYALLACALVFLVPRRRRPEVVAPAPRRVPRSVIAATAVLGALVPLVLVVALRQQPDSYSTMRDNVHAVDAPIDDALRATLTNGRLVWHPVAGHGARVHYVVLRATGASNGCAPAAAGARECQLAATAVGTTRGVSYEVGSAAATYRVAAAANYLDEPNGSDIMLLGPPVSAP